MKEYKLYIGVAEFGGIQYAAFKPADTPEVAEQLASSTALFYNDHDNEYQPHGYDKNVVDVGRIVAV